MIQLKLIILLSWILAARLVAQADFEALLTNSCLDCHDDATEKGGLSLETLDSAINGQNAVIWQKALEQVERGFMPPAGKPQPTQKEREAAVLDLENRLVAFHAQKPRQTRYAVLRRLNRTEYRNTIRDLLQLELGSDPTSAFPGDERDHGFATNGEKLVTSNFLLRQYLEAAEDIVSRAVTFGPKPKTNHWQMKPPFDRTNGREQGEAAGYYRKNKIPQPYQDICGRIGAGGAPYLGYHPLDDISDDGVPESGWYQIRIEVEAKFRHSFQYEYFTRFKPLWDGSEPIRLSLFTATLQGIDPANKEARNFAAIYEQKGQRHIATWDLPDDEKRWLVAKVWLEKGQFLRLGFPNGPSNSNHRIQHYFNAMKKATLSAEEFAEYEARKKPYGGWFSFHLCESPRVRLYQIEMEGPLNETWPPASHRTIFGDSAYESGNAPDILQNFATRAWRRPATAEEIAPLLKLVRNAESSGMSAEDAIQEGLKAILCSPEFIYREEKGDVLTDYEIASRLSYFLTASMPDETLQNRAAAGELADPRILRAEAERLLADPKSDSFVSEFLDGWLQLNKLGSMAPDGHGFSIYYNDRLEPAMRTETRLFFRHLLETNGPIRNFLDSDYTFANENLASFYGVTQEGFAEQVKQPVPGLPTRYLRQDGVGNSPTTQVARISLTDQRRGGLLGQASILTLTANGVDTSPVIRGVWLLENILGTPPPPPPPDVPAIEPDIRGAKTIREQLQKHRDSAACRSCHTHIDPPGFALESFNPIGGWRGHYRMGNKYVEIDPSGNFAGTPFADIVEFKAELLKREDAFARCLVEKLLLHALGRDLEVTDRPHIRAILDATRADGYRLRDLVVAVVESKPFSRK